MRAFLTALTIAVIAFASPASAQQHRTCTSFKAALAAVSQHVTVKAVIKLDKRQSAAVLADYNDYTGQGIVADQLYVMKVTQEDGSEAVGVAFTNKGCMLGISVANPANLAKVLGEGA